MDAVTGNISNAVGNMSFWGFGYSGDGGPAAKAVLDGPSDIAFDVAGNLFISDRGNNVIRMVRISLLSCNATSLISIQSHFPSNSPHFKYTLKVNASTGNISTVVGNYQSHVGYSRSGDGGPASSARLSSPKGLAFDAAGNLFIADAGNAIVRKVSLPHWC